MQRRNDGDAVHAGRVFHLPEQLARVGIQDIHLGAMRRINAVGRASKVDIVEAAIAGYGIMFGYFETGSVGGNAHGGQRKRTGSI